MLVACVRVGWLFCFVLFCRLGASIAEGEGRAQRSRSQQGNAEGAAATPKAEKFQMGNPIPLLHLVGSMSLAEHVRKAEESERHKSQSVRKVRATEKSGSQESEIRCGRSPEKRCQDWTANDAGLV